jgi:hypothetical protein
VKRTRLDRFLLYSVGEGLENNPLTSCSAKYLSRCFIFLLLCSFVCEHTNSPVFWYSRHLFSLYSTSGTIHSRSPSGTLYGNFNGALGSVRIIQDHRSLHHFFVMSIRHVSQTKYDSRKTIVKYIFYIGSFYTLYNDFYIRIIYPSIKNVTLQT